MFSKILITAKSVLISALKDASRRVPFLNNIFVAERLVGSIPEVILNEHISRHVVDIDVIRPTCIEYYSYMKKMPLAFRAEMCFPRRYIYRLKDVTVNTSLGACCSDRYGFLESFGSLRSWILSRPLLIGKSSRRLAIDGPVTCINSTGFAHFLMEELPRLLWALKHYPSLHLLTPPTIPRYIAAIYQKLRSIGLLNYDPVPSAFTTVDVADFVFTQAEASSGFWHSADIKLLRDVFLPNTNRKVSCRIYISRKLSNRSFNNEKDLEENLCQLGFKILSLEQMDFNEQINAFANSDIVVAPHGAGLANLVWCGPGTKVIEIFSAKVFNDCFARLSSQLSCKHFCCWSQETGGFGDVNIAEVIDLIAFGDDADSSNHQVNIATDLLP